MRFEIENKREVQMALLNAEREIAEAAKEVQRRHTEMLYRKLRRTSPVDTGYYKSRWQMDREGDEFHVINDDPKAQYLVFPNQRMIGSPAADRPSEGILHNARGITFNMQENYNKSMVKEIQKAMASSGM